MISAALTLLLCAAIASEPEEFAEVNDLPAPSTAPCDEEIRYQQLDAIEESRQVAASYEQAGEYQQWYESGVTTYYSASNDVFSADYGVSDGLNTFTGVNYHDGRMETFYSSQVLYHYRTPEWTLDSEGFYRTEEGYYVVAASDMEQGATFEGSKGTCIVLDCGCADGITDYYTNWG